MYSRVSPLRGYNLKGYDSAEKRAAVARVEATGRNPGGRAQEQLPDARERSRFFRGALN